MNLLHYICVDSSGAYYYGYHATEDIRNLAAGLQGMGYSMVWSQPINPSTTVTFTSATENPAPTPLGTNDAKRIMSYEGTLAADRPPIEISAELDDKDSNRPKKGLRRRERWIGAVLGLCIGVGGGIWYLLRPQSVPPEYREIYSKMRALKPYMNRGEIESIFQTRAPGVQFSTMTYYEEGPWLLQVKYDQEGGPWNPSNGSEWYMLMTKEAQSRPSGPTLPIRRKID